MIACLLSDFCLWETLSFLARGNLRDALRRRSSSGITMEIHGIPLTVYYHSPAQIKRAFSPYFRIKTTIGLNIFTPPPSSSMAYHTLRRVLPLLEKLDDVVSGTFPFNRIGDHFLIVLERTNA